MWTESHYDQGENRSKLIWNSLSQGKILGIQILIILFSMQCFHFSIFFLLQDSTWSANLSALNELRLNCTPKAFSQQQELRRKNNQPYYRSVGLVVLRSLQSKLKLKKSLLTPLTKSANRTGLGSSETPSFASIQAPLNWQAKWISYESTEIKSQWYHLSPERIQNYYETRTAIGQ